ncbi:MAG TPA: hypothetical protein VLC71_03960 [Thermomonas sp.]|nr:hypothetical protein [Thermomonas sp.]
MRIGPWVLGTGLLLLAAGVVTSRADAWDTLTPALTIPLAMRGIDTIDIRESGIEKVVVSSAVPAQVHYPGGRRFAWLDDEKQATPPSCRTTGATLRCEAGTRFVPGTPTMQLPPGRYRLLVDDVAILAQSDLESVAIDAHGRISWSGPVAELDVTLVPPPRTRKGGYPCSPPHFAFDGGRLRSLRIQAGAGSLDFDDVSEVGDIEVQAAADVRLQVAQAADIARIKVLPLAATPAVAADAPGDARHTCGGAARAAALAAMD